jgi:hypothetical protein
MTASAAEGLPAGALPGERDEDVRHEGPDGHTPEEVGEPERLHRAGARNRDHAATILFCLATVQVTWLAALMYGAYLLVR